MKELVFSGRAMLVGDAAADAMVEYSAVLARAGRADTVELRAIGTAGRELRAFFALTAATAVMAQTSDYAGPEPDNADTVDYIDAQIHRLDPDLLDFPLDYLDDPHGSDDDDDWPFRP